MRDIVVGFIYFDILFVGKFFWLGKGFDGQGFKLAIHLDLFHGYLYLGLSEDRLLCCQVSKTAIPLRGEVAASTPNLELAAEVWRNL